MNTTESKSEMIEKIRKLLALSQSSNQHEAELAAKRASELMTKYQISSASVEASSIKSGKERVADVHFEVPDLRMRYQWVITLGLAAAKLFDGTILVNTSLHGTSFTFVGFESELPLMRELFLHLYRAWQGFVDTDLAAVKAEAKRNVERMAAAYDRPTSDYASWEPKHTMKYKHGHGQGYATAIYLRCTKIAEERVETLRRADADTSSNACTALVLVRTEEVDRFLKNRGVGKPRKMRQTTGSDSGVQAGYKAGHSVALDGALTASTGSLKG